MKKPLLLLTASDLMSRDVVVLPQQMSLQGAARLLSTAQVSGAPVVDEKGQCVGVLSTTDFLRCVEKGHKCRQPSEFACQSWQILEKEEFPADCVRHLMTDDPVTVEPGMPFGDLARVMVNAHIHRVIVVDPDSRPIGIVTMTDILAAIAQEAQTAGPKKPSAAVCRR